MIEFRDHALENMRKRGATEDEVIWVLEHGRGSDARPPRLAREAVFTKGYDWKGRSYPHKLIKVIYTYDARGIVIVTVLVFFGRWKDEV